MKFRLIFQLNIRSNIRQHFTNVRPYSGMNNACCTKRNLKITEYENWVRFFSICDCTRML